MKALFLVLAVIWGMAGSAWAVDPSEMLSDKAAELRAEQLGKNLRCLVCQSESIEESNADLARDLRIIVRERIVAGDSNQQIIDYLVSRYGDYVLLRPPFKLTTWLLWLGPFLILGLGFGLARSVFGRRASPAPEQDLSIDEQQHLNKLIAKDKRE